MNPTQEKALSAAAPARMNSRRRTSAPAIPNVRSRWRSRTGTANAVNTSRNTKTLSSESDFSTR